MSAYFFILPVSFPYLYSYWISPQIFCNYVDHKTNRSNPLASPIQKIIARIFRFSRQQSRSCMHPSRWWTTAHMTTATVKRAFIAFSDWKERYWTLVKCPTSQFDIRRIAIERSTISSVFDFFRSNNHSKIGLYCFRKTRWT